MTGAVLAAPDTGSGELVLFWVLAPVMVLAALGLLFARKAVHAALSMAAVMVCLGVVYLAQEAPFLGVVQVFVYTGAVMMLFLFVLMLVGVDSSDSLIETIRGQRWLAALFGLLLAGGALRIVNSTVRVPAIGMGVTNDATDGGGNITALAGRIFGKYVWAFEVTSALLITAAVGAMVLAHRERLKPRPTQRELSEHRIREGAVKAPLPAPGVFARHNAVDTPALLPDGTPSELSVSRVLAARGQNRDAGVIAAEVAVVQAELVSPLGAGDRPEPVGTDELETVPGGADRDASEGEA